MRTVCVLIGLIALTTACANAAKAVPPTVVTDADIAALVDQASEGRAHLAKRFPGPSGLTGVIVEGNEPGGRQMVGWVTPDGQHLLLGSLFDAAAQDLSAQAYAAHIAPPELDTESFYQAVSQAPAVTQFPGGKRTLYIFADADCVYCHALFMDIERMRKAFEEASVRVRWVMVGTQSAESAKRGAAVLDGGFAALARNEQTYDIGRHRGGIEPSSDERLLTQIEANTRLLMQSSLAAKATPTLVWRSARGAQTSVGAPTENGLRAILPDISLDR